MNRRYVRRVRVLVGFFIISISTLCINLHLTWKYFISTDPSSASTLTESSFSSSNVPDPVPTLVHFDPYFLGGFRNQHMRFVAFVNFAVTHNVTQILLPSLRWSAHYNRPYSIQHDLLFDVHYWNARAVELGLPRLVNYDPNILEGVYNQLQNESSRNYDDDDDGNDSTQRIKVVSCFNISSSLFSGLDESILRHPTTNIRNTEILGLIGKGGMNDMYSHCRCGLQQDINCTNQKTRFTHLIPHGGIRGAGRLWNDYMSLQKHRGRVHSEILTDTNTNASVSINPEHVHVEKAVFELLRPSKELNLALKDALSEAIRNATNKQCMQNRHDCNMDGVGPRVLALHPRVEPEMLRHRCSKQMESNLTKVFERCEHFIPFLGHDVNNEMNKTSKYKFNMVFIAASVDQILNQPESRYRNDTIDIIMNENRLTFLRAREYGLFGGIPLFESGTDSARNVKFSAIHDDDYLNNSSRSSNGQLLHYTSPESLGGLELVASIINFFTAVEADIFVGVKGSSFSTDVFSARYYQSKSHREGIVESYIIGPDGIQRLYGPPPSHSC